MRLVPLILSLAAAALLAPWTASTPQAQTVGAAPVAGTTAGTTTAAPMARVIVKYKADAATARRSIQSVSSDALAVQLSTRAQTLAQRLGIPLTVGHGVSERSHVLFASGMTSAQLAARLSAESDVEYAVPDVRRKRQLIPNDPYYTSHPVVGGNTGGPRVGQWYLKPPGPATPTNLITAVTPNTAPAAIDAERAWDHTTGSTTIVVAVLDTGIRFDHQDFRTVANGGNILPGYDMISDDFTSSDGQPGRDADPSDPGDWVDQAVVNASNGSCTQADISNSSWHGTETAGLIGAVTNNGIGIASVGFGNVKVLPVRVLGKCGGFDSDIVAGMLWAAGLPVAGVPANANPARVINMSLGGSGTCTAGGGAQAYLDAMAQITAAGTVVVASAGNSTGHAVGIPANCPGVIGVAGLRHIGTKVGFSDLGSQISISAPGGNCINTTAGSECVYPIVSTSNSGTTTPVSNANGGSIYTDSFARPTLGTSFSAPLVAGTVALMLSVQPQLAPDEVRYKVQLTARTFPTPATDESGTPLTTCVPPNGTDQLQCICTTQVCGAGMLDARGAVIAAAGVQARITVLTAQPTAGAPVTLSAATSITPAAITSYQWTLTDGGGIVTALTPPTNAQTVSATPTGAGTFTVTLTMIDANGIASQERTTVTVDAAAGGGGGGGGGGGNPPPAGGGGGGGALGVEWLLGLLAAVVALGFVSRRERERR